MGHSSVLRARLKVLGYLHSASFPPPELFISCVHPASPRLSSRNPAGSLYRVFVLQVPLTGNCFIYFSVFKNIFINSQRVPYNVF